MFVGIIQMLAALAFLACAYHASQVEGQRRAQQWFLIGYLFAIMREILLIQFGVIAYSDQMLQFGSAPSVTTMLIPALFYISYSVAQKLEASDSPRAMMLLMFALTPALALPLDVTALHFQWWNFPSESRAFLNGVPYFVPLSWGLTAALFYWFMQRIRRIRLRGAGQFFAMLLATPLLAVVNVPLIALAQIFVGALALAPEDLLLNALLAILFIALPLSILLRARRRTGDIE